MGEDSPRSHGDAVNIVNLIDLALNILTSLAVGSWELNRESTNTNMGVFGDSNPPTVKESVASYRSLGLVRFDVCQEIPWIHFCTAGVVSKIQLRDGV